LKWKRTKKNFGEKWVERICDVAYFKYVCKSIWTSETLADRSAAEWSCVANITDITKTHTTTNYTLNRQKIEKQNKKLLLKT